jgi:hypothetical protein
MRLDEGVSYLDMLVMYADSTAVLGKLLYLWSRLEADGQDQWVSTVRPPRSLHCPGRKADEQIQRY